MFKNLRINLIQRMIHVNEALLFYPKLKSFYIKNLKRPQPLIIDVGANKGQTIDFFLGIAPDAVIHSFEPNPRLYNALVKKYAPNKNINIHNLGVSSENGTLTLQETVMDETSTFEQLNMDSQYLKTKSKILGIKPEEMVKKSHSVSVITLADFIRQHKLHHINALKIDTEGHEYKCMLGLFGSLGADIKIDFIQLEQHYGDMYTGKTTENDIIGLLNRNGFNVFARIKHGFGNFVEVVYSRP